MKSYQGRRFQTGCQVDVIDNGRQRRLPLRLDLANHSPTGFEWGYAGSGPAQLAVAILADFLGDDVLAMRLHQDFKFAWIVGLRKNQNWRIDEVELRKILKPLVENHERKSE